VIRLNFFDRRREARAAELLQKIVDWNLAFRSGIPAGRVLYEHGHPEPKPADGGLFDDPEASWKDGVRAGVREGWLRQQRDVTEALDRAAAEYAARASEAVDAGISEYAAVGIDRFEQILGGAP
jgi:hypothetical protein